MARAKTKKTKTGGRAKAGAAKRGKGMPAAKRVGAKTGARPKRPASRPRPAAGASNAVRELAQRIVDVTLSNDDEAAFALYAADIQSIEAGQPPLVGLDAIRSKFAGWRNMVTDTSFEPRRILVDGNVIVIEWLGRVTLAATGRQAELHEVAVHEIRDGKIAREAFFYNPAALA